MLTYKKEAVKPENPYFEANIQQVEVDEIGKV